MPAAADIPGLEEDLQKSPLMAAMAIAAVLMAIASVGGAEEVFPVRTKEESRTKEPEPEVDSKSQFVKRSKPFLYGKKFELQEFKFDQNDAGKGLVSPLIASPIRALPHPNASDRYEASNLFGKSHQENAYETEGNDEIHFAESSQYGARDSKKEEERSTTEKETDSNQNDDQSLTVDLPLEVADEEKAKEIDEEKTFLQTSDFDRKEPANSTEEESDTSSESTNTIWSTSEPSWIDTDFNETTSANAYDEDVTKTYTNYNDVEQVTRKFENLRSAMLQQASNHRYEADLITPYPVVKRLRNKTPAPEEEENVEQEISDEASTEKNPDFIEVEEEEVKTVKNFKSKDKNPKKAAAAAGSNSKLKPAEVTKVMEILPEDMKDVIFDLGLNEEKKEEEKPTEENDFQTKEFSQPEIDPKAFAVFKPLPLKTRGGNGNLISDEMKSFLASFDLLPVENRGKKSLSEKEVPERKNADKRIDATNLDFLPDEFKSILGEMGLVRDFGRKESTEIHVFNPVNHTSPRTDEDFKKLNAILNSIKTSVKNLKSPPEESASGEGESNEGESITEKENGKTRTTRKTKFIDGPDPLVFTDENLIKVDVKREDSSNNNTATTTTTSADLSPKADDDTTSSSSSSSSSSSASSSLETASVSSTENPEEESTSTMTSTTEDSNLAGLRDSFGGGETASDDADVDSALPPVRPNGLYFLLDWNSFLEVGTEDDKRRVSLKFQPKIGDSRNFLPVTIP